jgi:alpha,alpha-trehalase
MEQQFFDITSLGPLYEAVQGSGILADSKTFVDAIPKSAPQEILAAFHKASDQADFSLEAFLSQYFELPSTPDTGYDSAQRPIQEHLQQLWPVLTRQPDAAGGTLIPLPYPYVAPGGRFREIYYWDSYFTMLGLKVSGRQDLIEQMVENFAYLIDLLGFIPNGNRSYYLGRSQPPFFALMVELLAAEKGTHILTKYRSQLEKEYAFWMQGTDQRAVTLPDGSILNRYWDAFDTPRPEAFVEDTEVAHRASIPATELYRHIRAAAESGWDFSSRWFKDPQDMATIHTTDLIPVDLNCLLLQLERTLFAAAEIEGDQAQMAVFGEKIAARQQAIQTYCWSEGEGFYFDYDTVLGDHTERFTLAAMFPLFFKIADEEQAESIAAMIDTLFLHPGGVATTLVHTGQQWDAPNGWAPLQWITYQGLLNYGHNTLAETIRANWTALNEKTYAETGKMMEKYNVVDIHTRAGGGEYPNQDGFGWTNGVYLAMTQ